MGQPLAGELFNHQSPGFASGGDWRLPVGRGKVHVRREVGNKPMKPNVPLIEALESRIAPAGVTTSIRIRRRILIAMAIMFL
jgi:hypothetical protein